MKIQPLHLTAVAALLISLPSANAVDSATRRSDNVTLRGKFTTMDPTKIVIERSNGGDVTVAVSNLKVVRFDGEPLNLNQARSNERSGGLEKALSIIQEVSRSGVSDKRLKTELQFLTARIMGKQALADPTKAAAAQEVLQKFRTENKTNFRYLEATLLLASVQSAAGAVDEAKTLLQEVQQAPVTGYQLQAGVDLGRLLLQAGDAAGAQAAFDSVIQKSQGDESAAGALYDSMLGKAACLQLQNSVDEAIAILEDVISKSPASETRTLAEAWVRKGDCLRQKNETKAALMAYLHVDVLYPGEPAQHAEALARLTELWGPTGHEDRAIEASARLTERYPNSPWAKKGGAGG
ncbi:tetratricopeptide repeat protein [Fuerstiella marisgermanici]|uniref:Tol-pal system protein n=1 Tax=Fuerstiella marisgermanici TaxID=1891926 RepID=A0A1P8WMH9_9PLAN|nr:tetratricopeptide repeat protein [Fuerstiella marisgermanici]APZ95254.1 tol-pal system protein [Fuerstiella marisgermanici]